jgi:hypothetical protein
MSTLTGLVANFLVDGLHGKALADEGSTRGPSFPQDDRFGHETVAVGRSANQVEHLGYVKGLEQVIVGAEFHGLNGGFGGAEGGNQNDGQARLGGVQLADQLKAVQTGQFQIGNDQIEQIGGGAGQTVVAPLLGHHLVPFLLQNALQGVGDAGVIFDQQNFGGGVHGVAWGRTMPKVVP